MAPPKCSWPSGPRAAEIDEVAAVEQAVLGRVVLVAAAGRVEPADADRGAGPQPALAVLEDGADRHRLAGIGDRVVAEGRLAVRAALHAVQPARRADPEFAAGGDQHVVDAVVAQAGGLALLVAVMGEHAAGAVEAVQSIVGADPEDAVVVLGHGEQAVFAEAGRIAGIVAPGGANLQVRAEQVETGARDHPEGAVARLHHRLDLGGVPVGTEVDAMEIPAVLVAPGEAGAGAHPQAAVDQRHAVHHVARQRAGALRVVPQLPRTFAGRVEQQQAGAGRAHPQLAVGAGDDIAHLPEAGLAAVLVAVLVAALVAELGGVAEPRKAAAGQVGAAHAAETGADPERTGAVDAHRRHLVVRQAVLVEGMVAVGDETAAGGIAPLQAIELGADPQRTAGVVVQGLDAQVADALARLHLAPPRLARTEPPLLQPALGADPQRLARPHRQRQDARAAWILRAGRHPYETVRARGEARQAAGRADPEAALGVEGQGVDDAVARLPRLAVGVAQRGKGAGARIEAFQAVAGTEPEDALAVGRDRVHAAVGLLSGAGREQGVADELAAGGVEARQAALGAEPEAALGVLEGGVDETVRQGGRIVRIVAVDSQAVAVIAVQAGLGAEPHEALAVLQDGEHRFLGHAILDRQALEAQAARRGGVGGARRAQRRGEQRVEQYAGQHAQHGARRTAARAPGKPQHDHPVRIRFEEMRLIYQKATKSCNKLRLPRITCGCYNACIGRL